MPASTDMPRRGGLRRLSVAHFLIALVLMLVTFPFVDQLASGKLIAAALLTLVLGAAVTAVGGSRRTLIMAALLVTPAVIGTWLDHFRPGLIPKEMTLIAAMLFVAFIVVHLLGFILRSTNVDAEVLYAAIATYLMMVILWMFAYTLVARLVPGSFSFTLESDKHRSMEGFEALYFSFGAATTVDYGDIIPVSNAARMLAMMQATSSMFFVTILIARLVGIYSSQGPVPPAPRQNPLPPKDTY